MKKSLIKNIYSFIFLSIFIIDRVTKSWAYKNLETEYIINKFLSFKLLLNKGISWGFLNNFNFWILTITIIFIVILFLIPYMYARWILGKNILGEILVLSGAVSNIIDRFYYHGVIDFISLHWRKYYWPIFNLADLFIVLGVFLMFFYVIKEK